MITITERAAHMMKVALEQQGRSDEGLRLVAQAGGCSCCGPSYGLIPEREAHPDDVVMAEGEVKVFIDPASLALVEGATIDFIEDPEQGPAFALHNPEADAQAHGGGCGCQGEAEAPPHHHAHGHEHEHEHEHEGECGCGGDCGCDH